jgi:hypothetical protein
MKKPFALALAGLVALSMFFFYPGAVEARDTAICFGNYNTCRSNAFAMDASWVKVTLVLTVCDLGLGRCLLLA